METTNDGLNNRTYVLVKQELVEIDGFLGIAILRAKSLKHAIVESLCCRQRPDINSSITYLGIYFDYCRHFRRL